MKQIDELGISHAPWSICDFCADHICVAASSGRRVADVCSTANARLIAAAPDCYDALQRIVSATEGAVMDFPKWQKDLQKALDDAKVALAMAAGEEVKHEIC